MTSWAAAVAEAALAVPAATSYTLMPHQRIPATGFRTHVLLAGRGAGKTFSAMHWLNDRATAEPGLRARIIAPTLGDGVASCVEGVDGLLPLSNWTAKFNPTAPGGALVSYPNGSRVWVLGTPTAKDVDRLRALTNVSVDVFEEAAANPQLTAALQQAALGRRSGDIRLVVTTTPRPLPEIKRWLSDPKVTVVRATMADNPDLPEAYRAYAESLKGTRLYRQEVLGEIVDDVEGALWRYADIERSRVDEHPPLEKIAIGVDPAVGSGTTGIVAVGIAEGTVYVLEDASQTDASPNQWAAAVAKLYERWSLDTPTVVVAEDNQGGRLVGETLRSADLTMPVEMVTSRVSKAARATPVAVLWEVEDQKARLLPGLTALEAQMLEWDGSFSPDRLDACLVGSTPILTTQGERPIKDVRAGDRIWTRAGWRFVTYQWLARTNAPVRTVELSSGKTLTGTADHRVWTENRGWVELGSLRHGDTMSGWNASSTMGSSTLETLTARTSPNAGITPLPGDLGCPTSTDRSTSTTTDRSLKGSTSIMSTEIRTTTLQRTWLRCLRWIMSLFMGGRAITARSGKRILQAFALSPQSGTDRLKDWSGTESTEKQPGRTVSQTPSSANPVERKLDVTPSEGEQSTAHVSVKPERGGLATRTRMMQSAQSAGELSNRTGQSYDPRPVVVSVVKNYDAGSADVFDLEVEDCPEFVASGVIVHNCVHATAYLRGRSHGLVTIESAPRAPVVSLRNFRAGRLRA